jgi:N-methylhydantoinase B
MIDNIQLQVLWMRLLALVEEQAQILKRTAFSPIVRDCGDLSVGIFDPRGQMLAQAVTGTPGHVNAMIESVGHFLRHFPADTMRPGDAFITNDPWMGTGHLNDFVVLTPCFHRGKLVGLSCCTSHITDVGGMAAGADGTDVHAEGLTIPMLKLAHEGRIDEVVLAFIRANSRLPSDAVGDVYSLAACNDAGVTRLGELLSEAQLLDLEQLGEFILTRSRQAVLDAISAVPKGEWDYTLHVDGYDEPITLTARVSVREDRVRVNFTGTSAPVRKAINVPRSYAAAYAVFGLSCAIAGGAVPNNSGSLSAFELEFPERCILDAPRPLPVGYRHIVGQMIPDLIFGCLSQALPQRVPAEGTSCIWNISCRGTRSSDEGKQATFALSMTTNGGTGARPSLDGLSATAFPSGVMATSVEIFETRTPLVVWRKELRPDSGGAGESRGGLGQIIEIANREGASFLINAAFDRIVNPPRGRNGGADGAPGYVGLGSGVPLRSKGLQTIPAGETLVIHTPGGGGIGSPANRATLKLAEDLRLGLVSVPGATTQAPADNSRSKEIQHA